jgi:polysaccharide export outer membrane protein
MISLPLIGEVKADGSTVEELRKTLTAKLSEFLTEPEIDIQVTKINSKKYLILGEGANRPGAFPLTEPITVMEALSNAGGFRDFANPKKIYILRGSQRFDFNYKDVSKGKHLEQDIQIQNGDRIFIP